MFDRSFLPPADLEFVVMTDTHYMLDPGTQHIEFESRRRQSARSAHALGLIASLDPAFVVHLGDLVQEFPESDGFATSVGEALAQFEERGVGPRHVAGNHDVGDKPDPTMPTDWATAETVRAYHERFGTSWYSWDEGGFHFIVLNSQIMNGSLPEVDTQQKWLEDDLAAHAGMPAFIFMHLSPFLVLEDEQALGHYDNIDEPARSWLLDLIRRHDVRMLFSGHSHFSFFNRIGDARLRVVPSTAFTRPGFCEVFSSAPPPERGRDDRQKLGFLLLRIREGHAHVHLIRTNGETSSPDPDRDAHRVVTRTSQELEHSPLGLTLRHALAPSTEVPIAWQSTIRQPVRNDYPLLACVELGARHVRVPTGDLSNAAQRERLKVLRDEGVAITATGIWPAGGSLVESVAQHRDLLDGIEIQLPSSLEPDATCIQALKDMADESTVPVTLAPLLPREVVPGKQHARTRIGYHLDELVNLDRFLGEHDVHIHRALCRVDANQNPWDAIVRQHDLPVLEHIGNTDWAIEFADSDEQAQVQRAVTALFAVAMWNDSRLFMEPLVDLDRTMDAPLGLIDRLCNPRSVFHAVRVLNTILFGEDHRWELREVRQIPGAFSRMLHGSRMDVLLVVPEAGSVFLTVNDVRTIVPEAGAVRLIDLTAGTSRILDHSGQERYTIDGASVIVFDRKAG